MNARVILLAGPSGSGKTSLLRRVGAKRLKLDDFYRDGDEAGMPLVGGGITGGAGPGPRGAGSREASRIDWDHPDSWDAERAMRAILDLCAVGRTEVPIYSIPCNAAVGRAGLDIGRAHAFVAEGVFAAELIEIRRTHVSELSKVGIVAYVRELIVIAVGLVILWPVLPRR